MPFADGIQVCWFCSLHCGEVHSKRRLHRSFTFSGSWQHGFTGAWLSGFSSNTILNGQLFVILPNEMGVSMKFYLEKQCLIIVYVSTYIYIYMFSHGIVAWLCHYRLYAVNVQQIHFFFRLIKLLLAFFLLTSYDGILSQVITYMQCFLLWKLSGIANGKDLVQCLLNSKHSKNYAIVTLEVHGKRPQAGWGVFVDLAGFSLEVSYIRRRSLF